MKRKNIIIIFIVMLALKTSIIALPTYHHDNFDNNYCTDLLYQLPKLENISTTN